jgi:hypothetical protein
MEMTMRKALLIAAACLLGGWTVYSDEDGKCHPADFTPDQLEIYLGGKFDVTPERHNFRQDGKGPIVVVTLLVHPNGGAERGWLLFRDTQKCLDMASYLSHQQHG